MHIIIYTKEAPDVFELLLSGHIKQDRAGYNAPSVILKAYSADSSLSVVTCLQEYLKCTKPLRESETKLFVSFVKPYKHISRTTISRWIHSVMKTAEVDTQVFKPQSTRAPATLKAKPACVSAHDILQTAGWSSSRCFDLFYNKPVESSNFAPTVLYSY